MELSLIEKFKDKIRTDEHFSELIRGAGVAFVLRIFGIILGYLFTLLVTRILGAEAWGIFSLCLVVLQISSVIGRLGMDTALLRFTAEYVAKNRIDVLQDIYRKVLEIVLPVSILLTIFVYFLSPFLAGLVFEKPYLTSYFRIISFAIVPFVFLWIHSEGIRGLKKIKQYMLLQQTAVFGVALIFFVVGLYLMSDRLELPILSYVIALVLLSVYANFLWRKYLYSYYLEASCVEKGGFVLTRKTLLSISIPMLLSSSLALIMGWTDTIMLGIFRDIHEVGIYSVVLKILIPFSVIWVSLNAISAPKVAYLRYDKKKLEILIRQSSNILFVLSIFYLFIVVLFGSYMLKVFGSEFVMGSRALIILALGYIVKNSLGLSIDLMNVLGLHKYLMLISVLTFVINVILNYKLIPRTGIDGAAISTTLSLSMAAILRLYVIKRKLGILTLPKFFIENKYRGENE